MTPEFVLYLGQQTIKTALLVAAPIRISGMLVGLLVGLFQSVTQIQEMTLSFIPKIAVVILIFLFLSPWIMRILIDFTINIFSQISVISH